MRSTDEVYGSLAYDGSALLHVPLSVSKAFLVSFEISTCEDISQACGSTALC